MKKFVFGGALVLSAVLSLSCGGASCKQVGCSPACDATASKVCDTTTNTCVDLKTCSPVCDTGKYCDPIAGSCKDIPKTCSPACTGTMYCDTATTTCKETPVCNPVCDATKNMFCSN